MMSRRTKHGRRLARRVRQSVGLLLVAASIGGCTSSGDSSPAKQLAVTVLAPASCDISGCVGEGLDTASGAYTTTVEDLIYPGGLFGIELLRSYRSDRTTPGWFGSGWATIYETKLSADATGVTIAAPAGLAPRWRPEAPEGWNVTGSVKVESNAAGGHDVVWPSGERWAFTATGQLATMTSPYGQIVTIEWTGELPRTIRSSQGPTLNFTFSAGHVTAVSADDGRTATFDYEGQNLTASSSPGLAQQYRYNADQRLVELDGPSGATTITYASGRVAAQVTASGTHLDVAYQGAQTTVDTDVSQVYQHDSQGRLTRVTQGGRDLATRQFDSEGHLVAEREIAQPGDRLASEVTRTYADGTLVKEVVNGVETSLSYDQQGRVVNVQTFDGATAFEYDNQLPLPIVADNQKSGREELAYSDGFVTSTTDGTGVRTVVGRDQLGNPTSRSVGDQSIWSYVFDSEGNVVTTTSPSGRVWNAEWGPRATLLSETDPLGRRSTTEYDQAGRVETQIDTAGRVTSYTYNSEGRVASETSPDGLVTRYEYASYGSLGSTTLPGDRVWRSRTERLDTGGSRVTVTAPDGTTTESSVDSSGREFARRVLEADGTTVEQRSFDFEFDRPTVTLVQRSNSRFETRTAYDGGGHVASTVETLDGREVGKSSYEYNAGRVVAAATDESRATYRYDDAGRLVEVKSGGDTWIATFEGGLLSATEHNGKRTTMSYDLDVRANSFTDPAGITTSWQFDAVDRPISRSIGEAASTFSWSAGDQLERYRSPDGSSWSWKYDTAGRLAEAVEPRGVVTKYEYENGAVTRISTSGGDKRDDRFTYDARGLLQSAKTSVGSFGYEYDATGSPTTIKGDGTERWGYDAQGNVVEIDSDSQSFDLTYDEGGRLQAVTGLKSTLETTWGVDGLTAVVASGREPIRLATNEGGQLSSVRWNEKTAVDLTWSQDASFLQLTEVGSDLTQEYQTQNGQLASFASRDLKVTAQHQPNGYLESLQLTNKGVDGEVRFDQVGRPTTLVAEAASSSLAYDDRGRVSSVLTSRPGKQPEQTTVTYDGEKRKVDGDKRVVDALFSEDGAQRSPLPSSLANPLAASSGTREPSILNPETASSVLTAPEPSPLSEVSAAIRAATPAVTTPVGVRNLPHLAEQIAVAEITRLAPTMKVNGDTAVRLPVINPKNGRLADFNPFVDAAPSGLALGAVGRQSGDNSLFERAQQTLGQIVGGVVSVGTDVARFIIDNPIARLVISVGSWAAAAAACAATVAACVPLAATAAIVAAAESAQALATVSLGALHACSDGELARCGILVAGGAVAVAGVVTAARVGTALAEIYYAKRAYSAVLESGAHSALASGAVGSTKSDLLAALRFERVVAREVPVCGQTVCARLDSVTRDIFGRLRGVESKNGLAAKFTQNQQVVYPLLKSGSGYSFPNGLAGSSPEMILSRLEVQHWGVGGRGLAVP